MVLKKINGICSWLLTLVLLGHLGTMSYSMMTGWYDYNTCKNLAHLTAGIVMIHIIISLCIFFFKNDGAEFRNYKYGNRKTITQRACAIVIIALLFQHVRAFDLILSGEALSEITTAGILVTEILFFGAIFAHLAVSFSKSLIGLGLLRSDTAEKTSDIIAYIICALLFVLTAVALCCYVLK